jgi:peroxiredoxin
MFLAVSQVARGAETAAVDKLLHEYQLADRQFRKLRSTTSAEAIKRYDAWPAWQFIPRFLALAEAKPDDETAFRCCQWILARMREGGNEDERVYRADQKAWEILAAYHTRRPELPLLCFQTVNRCGPAQEQFLRGLLRRKDLSRENRGYATVALAELLAQKCEMIETYQPFPARDEFTRFYYQKRSPEWGKDLIPANAPQFKVESIRLFRDVLDHYADVPVTVTARNFEGLKHLGEKASKSLHALERLTIGAESPRIVGKDLEGRPLDLYRYRGRVVLVSFWFTGCAPCMHELPVHRKLLETYKGRPFALLSVCTDASLPDAQKTAAAKGMDWPCLFDGENGPISREWNVLSSPTIYVLNQHGVIVAKNLYGEKLERKLAELMQETK